VALLKIYYFNDETRSVSVHIIGTDRNEYVVLEKQQGRLFDVPAPETAIPWIKKWDYPVVLLSYILPENLPQHPLDASTKD